MMKIIYLLLIGFFSLKAPAQIIECSPLKMDELFHKSDKYAFIYIGAEWCKYCSMLEEITLVDPEVVELLNENFNFFKLPINYDLPILLAGINYLPKTSKNHELIDEMLKGEHPISYPAICIVNAKGEMIYRNIGFLSIEEMIYLIRSLN